MEPSSFESLAKISDLLNFSKFLVLGFGIAILWVVVNFLSRASSHIGTRFPSRRLLVLQIFTVCSFVIYIIGGFVLLYGVLDPPKELLIALGGSAAVAVGLSLKDLVSSLVAGLILLFDRPFQVGDRVAFGDSYGEIRSIGLRAVRLLTLDSNLVTIPNSRFMTDVVASSNAGALDMMVCTSFYVALDADLKLAENIIYETVATSRYVYLRQPIIVTALEKVVAERLTVELTAKAHVIDVKFEIEFRTDIVMRVESTFRELGIGRPSKNPLPARYKKLRSKAAPTVQYSEPE
jgi:small-conductance mechanosensitive channel